MTAVIETERLRLRGHELRDFDNSAAMWADENVTRFIGGKPSIREDSWRRFQTYIGHWALLGHGFWLIEDKASGQFLGEGGFGTFKRDLSPSFEAPEQGWAFMPSAHGKGYAYEAMSAAIAWGEKHFQRSDFVCLIAPENEPSQRLAAKLGYREYGRSPYRGEPSIQFRRA